MEFIFRDKKIIDAIYFVWPFGTGCRRDHEVEWKTSFTHTSDHAVLAHSRWSGDHDQQRLSLMFVQGGLHSWSASNAISIIDLMEDAMPNYEYGCLDCKKRVTIYQCYEDYGRVQVQCPNCGGQNLKRMISRVRVAKSEDAHLENLGDPSTWGDIDENDPRSMARFMRKMGRELGEDLPPEFDEVVDRLDAGESPEEIEKDIPELGGSDSDFYD
jgi:putative FmdB family regulatory protein